MSQLCCTWWLTGPWGPGELLFPHREQSRQASTSAFYQWYDRIRSRLPFWKFYSFLFCRCLNSWAVREPHRILVFSLPPLDPPLILQSYSEQAHDMHIHISQIWTCMFENQPQDLRPSQGSLRPLLERCKT